MRRIILLFVVILLSACGGDGSGPTTNLPPPNIAPTASAGAEQSADEGATVNLVGTGADSDGTIATYNWQQDSGTAVAIINADMANASFTAPMVAMSEVLLFRLTVTDDDGAAASDSVRFTVNDVPQPPPVITLTGDNFLTLGFGEVYTELGATATDSRGADISASILIDASAVDSSVPGEYLVTYDVSDSSGNAAETVTRTVTVMGSARLTDLSLTVSSLDQVFQPSLTDYTASVSVLVSTIAVRATLEEMTATITVNGIDMAPGGVSEDLTLVLGSNIIDVTVISMDGTTTETYVIDIERKSTVAYSQQLVPGDAEEDDTFGRALALDGDTAIIVSNGGAYVFTRSDGIWAEQQKLLASDGMPGDRFRSAALDGDMALIIGRGSAYVFQAADGVWAEQQKLSANDGASFVSVALDGDTAVFSGSGAAYVFEYSAFTWVERQKLTASDATPGFGSTVALDGDTLVIGNANDTILCYSSGSAYVFHRTDDVWAEQTKLIPSDPRSESRFGRSLAVEGDTIIVGAYLNSHDPQPFPEDCDLDFISAEGAAYVFVRNGDAWQEQQKLVASDADEDDEFGWGVALQTDTIVISANVNAFSVTGYVFVRSAGEWIEQYKLPPVATTTEWSNIPPVALNEGYVIIGARYDFSSGILSGSAFVFGGL